MFSFSLLQTYIGHILLLVNPNKELPIYSTLVSMPLNNLHFTYAYIIDCALFPNVEITGVCTL